jgi:hypothetical protein
MVEINILKSVNGDVKQELLMFPLDDFMTAIKEWKKKTDVFKEHHDEFHCYMKRVVNTINMDGTFEFRFEFEDDNWTCHLKSFNSY